MRPVAKMTISEGFEPTHRCAAAKRRVVAVVAFDGVVLGDLSAPCEVFGHVRDSQGSPFYEVRVCSLAPLIESEHLTLKVPWRLSSLKHAHTVIIPGIDNPDRSLSKELLRAVSGAVRRGARVASICSGAFVVAQTGALDGLKATTHWLAASRTGPTSPGG